MTNFCTQTETIIRKKGTSLEIEIPVYLEDEVTPANLIGASAKFSYKLLGSSAAAIEKVCTFNSNKIITGLSPSDTVLMGGTYKYEIRLKTADGYIDGQIDGKFIIADSINPWIS